MRVIRLTPQQWGQYSILAHEVVFNEMRDPAIERISHALLTLYNDVPAAYATCQELDATTVYWQYGGMFPSVRGTILSFRAYQALLRESLDKYERVCFRVENTNFAMLKFAIKLGFQIVGLRNFKGKVFLEHVLERGE